MGRMFPRVGVGLERIGRESDAVLRSGVAAFGFGLGLGGSLYGLLALEAIWRARGRQTPLEHIPPRKKYVCCRARSMYVEIEVIEDVVDGAAR
jgi:hypothetical protein